MFSPQGMFTGRDTADQIWKAFRSALMWAKVKSYLRHSKDRRVRGSANGASTVSSLLGTKKKGKKKRKKKISPQTGIFWKKKTTTKIIWRRKEKFSLALPPEQKLQDLVLFALMITDGAGRVALIVAAGISILFRGKWSSLKCERLFLSTPLHPISLCAAHARLGAGACTHAPLCESQQAAHLFWYKPRASVSCLPQKPLRW